ncbi:hypothetical protein HHL16_10545 [Pseudoflavitalea sp. G-6-1-2]|uniref:hypothetical protein n=1 Tax=Pseudoflavitalea sp. G-6-1-2 TaxID=2728841 RepID=UPI00146A2676|nr:hypothetical protein [Pseudoflavitalea sp. G-6-1-2]NML21314.1 hypothetical protein [Pseudoflavitalea sp. G-6-1-2]
MNIITVQTLELVVKASIEKLRKKGIEAIAIEDDWYWNVPLDKLNDIPDEPSLTVGSINDDIEFLNSLEENDLSGFLEFERLASLFKSMAKLYS